MTTCLSPARLDPRRRPLGMFAVALAVAATLLVGCGDKKKEKVATPTAAKVNKEEITVHQINFVLAQQRGIPPAQAASASRAVLERLIDQELALQKADEQKLDRDPRVVQQIEAARREIIARAYLEKIAEGAPKPTSAEVAAYYEKHPALFKERRVYSLQEVAIEATPEQVETLKKTLASAKTFVDFVNYLKANNIRFAGNEAVRGAEQLPLASVDDFAKMKDGQAVFNVRPNGAQVINLAASRSQPVTLDQATPAIEQFLRNERKRRLLADDMEALRKAAKIEYVGDFAKDAELRPYRPASAPELTPIMTVPPTLPASEVRAASQVDAAPIDTKAASMPSGSTLDKGLKGFK
jgi:EpsD family peptidyl-prolyl cis-trans isomerase